MVVVRVVVGGIDTVIVGQVVIGAVDAVIIVGVMVGTIISPATVPPASAMLAAAAVGAAATIAAAAAASTTTAATVLCERRRGKGSERREAGDQGQRLAAMERGLVVHLAGLLLSCRPITRGAAGLFGAYREKSVRRVMKEA